MSLARPMNYGYHVLDLETGVRWKVVFRDAGKWILGIYIPEITSREEVKVLERHNAPELFVLVKGKVTLVVANGNVIKEVKMELGKPYVVTGWHNAYRPEGSEGVVLVVERDAVKTEFRRVEDFKA